MEEPIWLSTIQVRLLHAESLRLFGGGTGLRDEGLLESVLARLQQRFAYEKSVDIETLAAEYAYGLARNHPFVDGNKRVALLAIRSFL
ncbi:MAG: type II toxin-antitoxin system death-on-curing family toxin [Rhodothermales bacterium]